MPDPMHTLLSVSPNFSIAMTIGYLKAKSAIRIHRHLLRAQGSLFGRSFWARAYFLSTVGIDEGEIRHYIKEPEELQKEQIALDTD